MTSLLSAQSINKNSNASAVIMSAVANINQKQENQQGLMISSLYQATLASSCIFKGIGVHSAAPVTMRILPAAPHSGIRFVRTDITDTNNMIPATYDAVTNTRMSTTITNSEKISVSTVEHVMAALSGCSITNAIIEIDGPEVPIMDGSSTLYTQMFLKVGTTTQTTLQPIIRVTQTVRVENDTGFVQFTPDTSRKFSIFFDFAGRFKGTDFENGCSFHLGADSFHDALSNARTFGLYEDGLHLQAIGLAKGASLENTVVLKDLKVLNHQGLRSKDELTRHKMLDVIGDMALSPAAIIGCYEAYNPSHELNNLLLRKLFAMQYA